MKSFATAKVKSYVKGRRGLLIDRKETHLDLKPEPATAGAAAGESCGTGCGTSDKSGSGLVKLKISR